MSGDLSRTRLDRLHAVLAGYVERGVVPGLVALVARAGDAHVEVIGHKSANASDPMRRDTIFRMSSMTKPITAVAALMLVEECKLRLDDPVDALLPELSGRKVLKRVDGPLDETVPARRPITLRDLLTFRFGFGMLMASPETHPILKAAHEQLVMGPPSPGRMPAPDEWMRRLGKLPLMYQPGERWLYNTGSDVLGVLVSRAAGQPFETFLHDRLFAPLGMRDTAFSVPSDKLDRFATSYALNLTTGAREVHDPAADGQWSRSPAFASGAAGLVSTLDDYLAFARMLLAGGKHGRTRILSRPSVELMTTDHLTPAQKAVSGFFPGDFDAQGYGFGVAVTTHRDNLAALGCYGWDGGLGTSWRNDPAEDLIMILLTQSMWTSPRPPEISRDFWTSAYQAIDD